MSFCDITRLTLTHVESVYKQLRPKNSAHYFRAYLTLRQAVEPLLHRIQLTPVDLYADSDPSLVALRTGSGVRRDGVSLVKHNHFDKQTENSEVKGKSLIYFPINSQHNKTQNIRCYMSTSPNPAIFSGCGIA